MADVFTKRKRSKLMAAIRSKDKRDTELVLIRLLRQNGITGWRRHQPLPGKPDFSFREERLTLFVDGCFWHGCPRHGRVPASNRAYWRTKLERNKARDREVGILLRTRGWRVLRIWEHELRHQARLLARIAKRLGHRLHAGPFAVRASP